MTLYALLVGIDAYVPPANALYGCRNDIAALEQILTARAGAALSLRTLYDAEATRGAVVAAFREHLGQAGAGDVALFAYAGHGSEEPAPPEVAHLEPSGRIQTLMLHDCNRRIGGELVRALADKELSLLLAEVAAKGPHLAVILDCCHSGGGTRDPFARARGWRPDVDAAPAEHRDLVRAVDTPRVPTEFLPGALDGWSAPRPPHVALAACRSHETAKEHAVGGVTRGAFSIALAEALDALGSRTTYRTLLSTVRSRVERTAQEQRPELFPVESGGPADTLFLDGTVTPAPSTFTMTRAADGWRVDAGLVHGLRPPEGDEAYVLTCTDPDGTVGGTARVTTVDVGWAAVAPDGWEPRDVAYGAVVTDVPLPPATVATDPPSDGVAAADVAAVEAALGAAIASAGPGGQASPHVHLGAGTAGGLHLRVGVTAPGVAQIRRADGSAISTPITAADTEAGARLVAARLEHVARWEQVRALGSHPSPLADAVALDVYAAEPGATTRPPDVGPLPSDGGYQVAYRPAPDGTWLAPAVHIDLRNTTDADLYVAVLDLTDRFRCHAVLPAARLAAGHTLALWDGDAIPVSLPEGRAVEPGASARDWLKVVVSDVDFDASAFDLPALDDPGSRSAGAGRAARTTLERMAGRAASRDIGGAGEPPVVARWAATTVALETVVPVAG